MAFSNTTPAVRVMVRISKKAERRAISPRRPKVAGAKTGPKKDNLPKGYREHTNGDPDSGRFIPKAGA